MLVTAVAVKAVSATHVKVHPTLNVIPIKNVLMVKPVATSNVLAKPHLIVLTVQIVNLVKSALMVPVRHNPHPVSSMKNVVKANASMVHVHPHAPRMTNVPAMSVVVRVFVRPLNVVAPQIAVLVRLVLMRSVKNPVAKAQNVAKATSAPHTITANLTPMFNAAATQSVHVTKSVTLENAPQLVIATNNVPQTKSVT